MARKKSAAKRAREDAGDAPEKIDDSLVKKSAADNLKKQSDSEDNYTDSSSEEEDEYGDLITERVEEGISKVLETIRNEPKKLLDPKVKFFDDSIQSSAKKVDKDKPIYLKDYHRMNLLDGGYKNDDENEYGTVDNEYGTVDGEKPYTIKQKEEKDQILSEINKAFSDEEEDDFLQKKERKREIIDIPILPDPNQNSEGFLTAFLDNQSWIPKKGDKIINLDQIDRDDENDFEDAVENFEHAYNFRYEDSNAAEIVSYARNQATLRRSNTNSRKRQRDKKIDIKIKEKDEIDSLLKKKKTSKVNQVMDRLAKVKQAVGDEVSDDVIQKVFGDSLLNDDFDDTDWDNKMAQIFDEQYYDAEIQKPTWDEDDEIMADFKSNDSDDNIDENIDEEVKPKKSKKDELKQKKSAKKDKELLKEKAQKIVEANTSRLLDEVDEERGRSNEDVKFKYREVSPETFGLSNREILLADDKQLNQFIGIKKFAPYRAKELRMKDKRKYTKKKHLQQWRKETFNDKNGPEVKDDEHDVWIKADEPEPKKAKK